MRTTNKNQYFKKDKLVDIYRSERDEETEKRKWKRLYEGRRCYTSQTSYALVYVCRVADLPEEERFFVFNPGTDIKPDDVIIYRDEQYEVQRVYTKDDYNREIYAYVKNIKFHHNIFLDE